MTNVHDAGTMDEGQGERGARGASLDEGQGPQGAGRGKRAYRQPVPKIRIRPGKARAGRAQCLLRLVKLGVSKRYDPKTHPILDPTILGRRIDPRRWQGD